MEIILRQAVENLGHAGEVVKVRSGYARNFLLPRKLAYPATPGNLKIMEQERANLLRREAKQRDEAEKLRAMLDGTEVRFQRRVGEQDVLYGSVTTADIADALAGKGFTIDKRKVTLDQHIKTLGVFTVPVRLFPEVTAQIQVHVESDRAGEAEAAGPPDSAEESE